MIVNLEAQNSDKTPYPIIKRAIYYVSRMISAQKIQMSVDEDVANTITEYSIEEKNTVGKVKGDKKDYDLLSVILLRLGNADQAKSQPILRLLDVLLSSEKQPDEKKDILEKDFDIPMTMSKEVQSMCNLGEGIYERAEKEKAVAVAKKMLELGKNTPEEIAAVSGLSIEEIEAMSNLQPV